MKHNYTIYAVVAVLIVISLLIGIGTLPITGGVTSRTSGSCVDTEPKNHIYKFGVVNFYNYEGVHTYPDVCLSDGRHIKQYLCGGPNRLNSFSHTCAKGCLEGGCIR